MSLTMSDVDFESLFKELVDVFYVVQHQTEMETITYHSSYAGIETDGTYESHIDADSRLLIITNLTHANYIVYLDEHGKIILYIYRQIPEIRLKDVIDAINRQWDHLKQIENASEDDKPKIDEPLIDSEQLTHDEAIRKMLIHDEGLVDLNALECDICGSTEFNKYELCADKKTIEAQCSQCKSIFRLVPSKYYMVHSKTVFLDNGSNEIDQTKFHTTKEE